MTEKCFACGKKRSLTGKIYLVKVLGEDQTAYVGPECYEEIYKSGRFGFFPPKGGPALILPGLDPHKMKSIN